MKTYFCCFLVLAFTAAFVIAPAKGAEAAVPPVAINEVAWAGTVSSSRDEWIELINNTATDIDLTGWTLKAQDGRPAIVLNGVIPASGYHLLERGDDTAVADVPADQIYKQALENGGEVLELRDPAGTLIDSANLDGGRWPAGKARTRASMERVCATLPDSDGNWATNDGVTRNGHDADGNPINGTPKAPNSQQSCGVTAITLIDFRVTQTAKGALLTWETGTELDNVGFDLYRAEAQDGEYLRINAQLIPATGDKLSGGTYAFLDEVSPGTTYYYILEDIDVQGVRTRHGPVELAGVWGASHPLIVFLPAVHR